MTLCGRASTSVNNFTLLTFSPRFGLVSNLAKLCKALSEFRTYIAANRAFIPNYRDRYRYGEIISTAFVESAVNQIISKRFVKKQPMRWTRRGAHLLLQVRVQVLNEDWHSTFLSWYPRMPSYEHEPQPAVA